MNQEEALDKRRERIQLLKRIIVIGILMAIIVPTISSIVLGTWLFLEKREQRIREQEYQVLSEHSAELERQYGALEAKLTEMSAEYESDAQATLLQTDDEEQPVPQVRRIYLTFDDGPSNNTERILDILKTYEVKATFFVVGKPDPYFAPIYRRIVDEGHTLGMHSYSHQYEQIYQSVDTFAADLDKLQNFLYETTGVQSRYYRFPGGSSNQMIKGRFKDFTDYLKEQDIVYYDWNVSSGDATASNIDTDQLLHNCLNQIETYRSAMILLHDAGEKNSTVEALPQLIEALKSLDHTEILPISEDTTLIQHIIYESEEE